MYVYMYVYIYTRILKSSIPSTYHSILLRIRGTLQPCDERRRCCPCRNGNRPGKNGGKTTTQTVITQSVKGRTCSGAKFKDLLGFFCNSKKIEKW